MARKIKKNKRKKQGRIIARKRFYNEYIRPVNKNEIKKESWKKDSEKKKGNIRNIMKEWMRIKFKEKKRNEWMKIKGWMKKKQRNES